MSHRKAEGFTLVELLVVIGIVTLLVAMLLPVLNSAMDAARRITCASNLRQLDMAMFSYLNDNQQTFPRAAGSNLNINATWGGVSDTDSYAGEDMCQFYKQYLGGSLGTKNVYASPKYLYTGLYPSTTAVVKCPSNPDYIPSTNVNNAWSYPLWAASANNQRIKPIGLISASKAGGRPSSDSNPAIWSDKVMGSGAALASNNHWDRAKGRSAGGYVACLDGSVQWFPFAPVGTPLAQNKMFYAWGWGANGTQVAVPSTACFMLLDGAGNFPGAAANPIVLGVDWLPPTQNPF